jgi:hypothetical protein
MEDGGAPRSRELSDILRIKSLSRDRVTIARVSDLPRERLRRSIDGPTRSLSPTGGLRLSGPAYQGIPLRSGTLAADGSGSPPAMRISAISRMPANPPPTNATINHQAETIYRPRFPWSRYSRLKASRPGPRFRTIKNPAVPD